MMALELELRLDGEVIDTTNNEIYQNTNLAWEYGPTGKVSVLNGASSNIYNLPESYITKPHGSFSVSFTVMPLAQSAGSKYIFLSGRDTNGGVGIRKAGNTHNFWLFINGSRRSLTFTLSDNRYSDVACVYDATEGMKVYVNGNLVSSNAYTGTINYPQMYGNSPSIGSHGGIYHYKGKLCDFRLFSHALSKKEVADLAMRKVIRLLDDALDNTQENNSFSLPTPRVLGDMSLEFWIYPTTTSVRQTLLNKGYGGEGTINFEKSGVLRAYFGPNGNNNSGYRSLNTSKTLALDTWHHCIITRDTVNKKWTWYLNGSRDNLGTFSFGEVGKSTYELRVGDGYTSYFRGGLKKIIQYGRVLTPDEVKARYCLLANLDNKGNLYVE
jgi:hypothetical protein